MRPNRITRSFMLSMCEVDKNTGCFNWSGSVGLKGYGQVSHRGKNKAAHRVMFLLFNGRLGKRDCVLHRCDNPGCINPDHLFAGTRGDNNKDRSRKGRSVFGDRHPLSKLDDDLAMEIYLSPLSSRAAAEKYNISKTLVKNIRNRKTWRHIHDDKSAA